MRAVAEVHGVQLDEIERRRTLVMEILLGQSGSTTIVGRVAERTPPGAEQRLHLLALRAGTTARLRLGLRASSLMPITLSSVKASKEGVVNTVVPLGMAAGPAIVGTVFPPAWPAAQALTARGTGQLMDIAGVRHATRARTGACWSRWVFTWRGDGWVVVLMRRFAFPEQWERVPALEQRVHELLADGRRRTALDEVLRHLRKDPGSIGALSLALVLVGLSRTGSLRATEAMTDVQRWCALLAPIMTQCTHCRVAWYSDHVLLANAGVVHTAMANPVGLQCQKCRYSLCRDCLERRRRQLRGDFRGEAEPADVPCPASGCDGVVTTPVFPTGCHDIMLIDPDDIEAVVVVRDGLIPPTMADALLPVTKFLPLIADDAPIIHLRRSVPGMMTDDATRDELASSLVRELERDAVVAPAASVRSEHLFIRAGEAIDADYLIVVVRKGVRHRSPDSSGKRAEQVTYSYLLQVLPMRGGWGTLRDSYSGDFLRGSFGVVAAAEETLADVAHDIMKRFDHLSLKRRVLFFAGDRTKMNLSMDDVCGVVVEGGDLGTP